MQRSLRKFSSSSVSIVSKKFKVLFCGHEFSNGFKFSKEALSRFSNVETVQCSRENLHKELKSADIVVPLMCRMNQAEIDIGKRVKMIMQYGIGLEGVDIPAATKAGIWVHEMNRSLQSGGLGNPMGRTLYKSKAIIYGYGGIGKQLLHRLKAFDMEVVVVSRNTSGIKELAATAIGDGVQFITTEAFHSSQAGRNADLLFVCCSQNADNMGLVNSAFLRHLKPGLLIVNVARGGLLNYPDVHAALLSGKIGGLGLDVFHTEPFPVEDPLLRHPAVVATPHIAGVTEVSYRNMAEKVAENVGRILSGQPPVDSVNNIMMP